MAQNGRDPFQEVLKDIFLRKDELENDLQVFDVILISLCVVSMRYVREIIFQIALNLTKTMDELGKLSTTIVSQLCDLF